MFVYPSGTTAVEQVQPDMDYQHRAFYMLKSCGVHRLYAWAWLDETPGIFSTINTTVTLDPVASVNALIATTKGTEMLREVRLPLLALLNDSLDHFQNGQTGAGGVMSLQQYNLKLKESVGKGITAERAGRLT